MTEGERLAQRLAEDFSLERLKDFLFEKDFTVEESQPPIELKEKLKENVRSIRQVAYKELEDTGNFKAYAIELKENITERSSKKRQFEIAKEILKADRLTAGLFVFYPQEGKSFRFSLVFKEPYGTTAKYSPYKRYTYFVSPELPNKTFIKQVGGCEFKNLKEIKSAFSVQPLTKEFYKEIQTWFYHALENCGKEIFFPGGQKEENLIRLITRLMFVWFIKQMGLVPEKLFDPKELKNIVKDFGNGHNYYNAILQNLFFATLNRPINERGWAKDEGFLKNRNTFGIKSLYRYEDKFLIPPEEVLELFENIPFINGGLFECLDKDSQYIDGFSRRSDKQAKVPDKYFFQEEKQKTDLSKHGLGKAEFRGLISIFKDYNWTTDESSPIDQEVALDPELLGKVFENLLASYNPETATTARKATGSYYTPKEIVDYMVEESLKEYFKTKTSLSEEKIENLFYQEEPQLSDEERKELVRAIADVKIIDPACGSGAFCMGALHKLVELLNRIDPTNELWKAEQQRRLTEKPEKNWEREFLLEVFDKHRNEPDYGRKLYLIRNCIYGVDIQPIAVQLTKLRFFLSLILDQKPDKSKDNFNILPLPHLETKFVCANTLIGLESSRQRSMKNPNVIEIEHQLKEIRKEYFTVKDRKRKQELEEKDRNLRQELAKLLKGQGWNDKDIQKIASFDILDPTARADWFDPEWMFGVVDGFDVVIGNPPYGDLLGKGVNINTTKKLIEKHYRFSTTSDISSPFIEKGVEMLKPGGNLFYIITFAITFNKDFSKSRLLLNNKFRRIEVISFDRDKCSIFESMSQSVSILKAIDYEGKPKTGFFTSRMFRETPDIYNIELSPANDYLLPRGTGFECPHRLPKIGEAINLEILKKLVSFRNKIRNVLSRNGRLMYIRTSGNYWYNAWDKKPYESSKIKPLYVKEAYYDFIVSLVNTSLFYFWFRVYGDGRDMNEDIFEEFRIPEESKILQYKQLLNHVRKDLMKSLFSVFDEERKRFETSRVKDRIDLADFVICRYLYGFDYKHIKHILDYDKEVRTGIKLDENLLDKINQIISLTQSPDFETSQEKQQKVKELEREIDQLVYRLYGLTEEEIRTIELEK